MSEGLIVPFADLKASRAREIERSGADPLATISELLGAMEGMDNQIHSLIQLVSDQERRIRALEKAGKSSIIKVAP